MTYARLFLLIYVMGGLLFLWAAVEETDNTGWIVLIGWLVLAPVAFLLVFGLERRSEKK